MPYAVLYPVFTASRPAPVPSGPSQSILGPASFSAKSFPCHTYGKCARKSFPCHTYKNKGLKVLCLPHLQKNLGGGGPIEFLLRRKTANGKRQTVNGTQPNG